MDWWCSFCDCKIPNEREVDFEGCGRCRGKVSCSECAHKVCSDCRRLEFSVPMFMVTEKLGDPDTWVGNCHSIACALLHEFPEALEGAVTRYGHYLGDVDPGTHFYSRASKINLVNHGWLELPDGRIVDPTRWVFQADVEPYIYCGPNKGEYDSEGQKMHTNYVKNNPCPAPDGERRFIFEFPQNAFDTVVRLIGDSDANHLAASQAFWLGNVPPAIMGDAAKEILDAFEAAGERALIPRGSRIIVYNLDSMGNPTG